MAQCKGLQNLKAAGSNPARHSTLKGDIMIDRIKDYIGWWMLIPAIVIVLLQVPGCVQHNDEVNLKKTQVMTQHCASQGKTYLVTGQASGQCI